MAAPRARPAEGRKRGEIETLPSGSPRVEVYAGIDPLTGKRNYLTEVVPAGPTALKEAKAARIRLINQVDEQRSPRTKATVNQLMDGNRRRSDSKPHSPRSRGEGTAPRDRCRTAMGAVTPS